MEMVSTMGHELETTSTVEPNLVRFLWFFEGIPDVAESFLGGRSGNTGTGAPGAQNPAASTTASSAGGLKGLLMKDANGDGKCKYI